MFSQLQDVSNLPTQSLQHTFFFKNYHKEIFWWRIKFMHAVSGLWQYHKQYFLLSRVTHLCLGWESKQCKDSVKFASWITSGFCLKVVPSLLQHMTSSHRATPTLDWKTNVLNIYLLFIWMSAARCFTNPQLSLWVSNSGLEWGETTEGAGKGSLGIPHFLWEYQKQPMTK